MTRRRRRPTGPPEGRDPDPRLDRLAELLGGLAPDRRDAAQRWLEDEARAAGENLDAENDDDQEDDDDDDDDDDDR